MSPEKTFDVKQIGKRLKEVRKKIGKTLEDMRLITGLSQAGISEMENGIKKPSSVYMFQLRMKFDVNINWVLTGEGTMFRPTIELNLDFGEDNYVIKDLILAIKNEKAIRYEILSYFSNIRSGSSLTDEESIRKKK